jgi:manganese transport protein
MLMSTAAAVLRGRKLEDVGQVAQALGPLFGDYGQALFCIGLFCAAYSSFLVNSMVGGFILSDGLNLGSAPRDLWPRIFSAAVLLTGMGVALYVIRTGARPVVAIVLAQAATVLAAPLLAGVLWWLTSRRDVMGEDRIGLGLNLLAGAGFLLLLVIAGSTAVGKVLPAVQEWVSG